VVVVDVDGVLESELDLIGASSSSTSISSSAVSMSVPSPAEVLPQLMKTLPSSSSTWVSVVVVFVLVFPFELMMPSPLLLAPGTSFPSSSPLRTMSNMALGRDFSRSLIRVRALPRKASGE